MSKAPDSQANCAAYAFKKHVTGNTHAQGIG